MKTRRDKLDAIFSQLVRERAEWKCERCKKDCSENPGSLHASHTFSRRKLSTRFDPWNCSAHCFSCHQYLGENPVSFAEWAQEHMAYHYGAHTYRLLITRQSEILKLSKKDKQAIYERMKESLAWMQQQRKEGATGRLEFPSPYERVEA